MPTNDSASTLDQLVSTAQAAVAQSIELSKKKQENATAAQGIASDISNTLKIVSGDVATVTATKQAAELKVQAENARVARAAGIDPETGANILVDTVTKLRQSNAEVEANLKEYRRKTETSFFDHPIDYIVNQITLPATEEKLQNSAKQASLYNQQLTEVNNTLQNSFQTNKQLEESITATSATAATRVAAAQSLIESQKYQLEALKYNTLGIDEAQKATADQLNMIYNVFNAQKAEQQLKLAQESNALSRERFNFEKAIRQETLDAKREGKVLDEVVLHKINTGRAASGMAPLEGPEAQFALAKMKSGAGGDVQTYYELGDRVVSTGQISFGNTPAEATRTLTATPTNLPDIKRETAAVLSAALQALQASKTVDHKDKAASDAFVNKFVNDQIKAQYSSIIPNAQNLFDVGDLSSYLSLSAIKDLPVTQKVLVPLAASNVPLNDPKLIFGFLKKAVKDGTLTTSQVTDITTVYRKANLINQEARDFRSLGIIPPNAGRNYFAKVSSFGKPVDMTDPVAVQHYISREMANDMANEIGVGGDPTLGVGRLR